MTELPLVWHKVERGHWKAAHEGRSAEGVSWSTPIAIAFLDRPGAALRWSWVLTRAGQRYALGAARWSGEELTLARCKAAVALNVRLDPEQLEDPS